VSSRAQQQREALERANQVRTLRSALKVRWKRDGVVALAEATAILALSPPPHLETARVSELLDWLPQIGQAQARRLMRMAGFSPFQDPTLEECDPELRMALAGVLDERHEAAMVASVEAA
jgi:hypothetical protein